MSKAPQDGRVTLAEIFAAARAGDLSAVELRLWLIVRSYDSGSGCYAATDTLAAEMRLSRRYVESLRSGLVKRRWLELTFRGPKEPMLRAVHPQQAPHHSREQEQEAPHHTTEQGPKAPHKAPNCGSVRVRGVRKDTDGASQGPDGHPPPTRVAYPPSFERFWTAYPTRAGGNPKKGAHRQWRATLRKGVTAEELEEAAARYAVYCDASRKTGTEYVKQASTFLGPDEHWREDWAAAPKSGSAPEPALANLQVLQ